MQILVNFDGFKWTVAPDPAVVTIGTPIEWRFQSSLAAAQFPQLLWRAYFDRGSPFGGATQFEVTSQGGLPSSPPSGPSPPFDHDDKTNPEIATDPGEYKYGVQVEDPSGGVLLGDDDPRLIVNP